MSGTGNEHVVSQLCSKGKVTTVIGGPEAVELARLLAKQAENAVVMQPAEVGGIEFLREPTGATLSWLRGITVIIVLPEEGGEAGRRAAVQIADVAIYAADGFLYVVKGGLPNQAPIELAKLGEMLQ